MKLEAVCFDIDGTLYPKWQTSLYLLPSLFPSPFLAIKYQMFRRGIRRNPDEGGEAQSHAEFLEKQATLMGSSVERVERQFYKKWRSSFKKIKAYPQVRETFEWLKGLSLKVAILSDFPIEEKLTTLGVADLVDFAICSEQSGYLKPHPKPFLEVSQALGVDPSAILYVGDSYSKDIEGANGVGMYSALIGSGKKRGATFTFSDYNEFKKKFENYFCKGERC
ncbi:MAG: HAD family hydrolase [Spirochaetales bacterium]|nr:HAD family hydrolase [Spirochaetales bacterium]